MVTESLVESDIEDGRKLLDELKSIDSHFLVEAAFWLLRPEVLDWRLYIASPLVDQRGTSIAYTKIQGALRSLPRPLSISMQEISVVSPADRLAKVIKKTRIPNGVKGVRFAKTRLDDTYIEDAYVYRVRNGRS
jgi:hypothetical protein